MLEIKKENVTCDAGLPVLVEPLVCRRVITKGVVVASLHPIAGPIYWDFSDESDCNAPDYYGLTDKLDSAMVFSSGYYQGASFTAFRSRCLDELSDTEHVYDEERDEYDFVEHYSLKVEEFAKKARCTPAEFAAWLYKTTWVEYPAPVKINFLCDFNGFIGYRAEWSEDVRDALHWSHAEISDKNDLDVELARSYGHFVTISQAMVVTPTADKPSDVNHALEADCALTLDRLGVRPSRDWSRLGSGMASWNGNLQEAAWIHAARAGIDHIRSGEVLPVSNHISTVPELMERFEMAASLARYETKR